jgi:hypothetical protein
MQYTEGNKQITNDITFICKLYMLSTILEPLLLFVIFERETSGIGGNISRFFQGIVVVYLIITFFKGKINLNKINFGSGVLINYWLYIILAVFSGLYGFAVGAYDLPITYDNNTDISFFSSIINNHYIRPLVEYFVNIYYFVYYVIIFQYFIYNLNIVKYYIKMFKRIFIISYVLGMLDIGSLYLFGVDVIPRHIADGVHVGLRFHGLAGEPRDAFVYLFLGLAILYLNSFINNELLSKYWIFAVILAALLTQSASGLIGILIFIFLYSIYVIISLKIFVKIQQFMILIGVGVGCVYLMIENSERIIIYLDGLMNLWHFLSSNAILPYGMLEQKDNIYPIYDMYLKIYNLNLVPMFIGNGFGTASIINNIYSPGEYILLNPHSQLIRIIYEGGIMGLIFYILTFTYPVKFYSKYIPKVNKSQFIIVILLLLSCTLAHRSSANFIFLGLFISVLNNYKLKNFLTPVNKLN